MVRLVACVKVALVLDHAQYLHALPGRVLVLEQRVAATALSALEHGGEHRVTRTVGLVDARRNGLGVGDVRGHGVQASGLGTHAATGNVENTG
ncbi:hypothetical protein D9M71_766890 [compost metagenome]